MAAHGPDGRRSVGTCVANALSRAASTRSGDDTQRPHTAACADALDSCLADLALGTGSSHMEFQKKRHQRAEVAMSDVRVGTTEAQEESGRLTGTVSEQATRAKESGRRELREQLDERTTQIGQQARSLADAVRRSGATLQAQGKDELGIERITEGVADRLERAAGYLERVRGEEMLRDAERFVRERPWILTSAAAAAGLIASRVVKASSEKRYEGDQRKTSTLPAYSRADYSSRGYDDLEPAASGSRQTAGTAY